MSQKIHQLFKETSEINPPEKLEFLILQKIEIETQKQIQRKLALSYVWLFGSALLLIYSGFAFGQTILQSEFWRIASLFFSDMRAVLTNWQDFIYSLLENFPIFNIIAILAPIVLLLHFFGKNLDLYHQSKHKFVNF
ncbi:MAG TPA: hypothetical protein P5232_01575 [Candidatus Moranbacteria bacterium]|nr:hypothetical protein [Candidatus Moranbacteria bacterium]